MNEDPGAPNYDPKHKIIRGGTDGSALDVIAPHLSDPAPDKEQIVGAVRAADKSSS